MNTSSRYSYQLPHCVRVKHLPLTSPNVARSNPHGQHTAADDAILRYREYQPVTTNCHQPTNAILRLPSKTASCIKGLFSAAHQAYALLAHPHGESGLVTSDSIAHIPRLHAVFLCVLFSYAPVMVWLNGEAFAPASFLWSLLTNPVQSNHPHLVMSGSTSIQSIGVTND